MSTCKQCWPNSLFLQMNLERSLWKAIRTLFSLMIKKYYPAYISFLASLIFVFDILWPFMLAHPILCRRSSLWVPGGVGSAGVVWLNTSQKQVKYRLPVLFAESLLNLRFAGVLWGAGVPAQVRITQYIIIFLELFFIVRIGNLINFYSWPRHVMPFKGVLSK